MQYIDGYYGAEYAMAASNDPYSYYSQSNRIAKEKEAARVCALGNPAACQ
jgi:hypothetical protein